MKHRLLGLGVALVCACTALPGCELLHHEQRSKASEPVPGPVSESDEPAPIGEVASKPTQGFFKSTRLSGAWSDEGRSIERNLGVQ